METPHTAQQKTNVAIKRLSSAPPFFACLNERTSDGNNQGTIGWGAPNVRVPMVFSRRSLGVFGNENTHKYTLYRAYIGISHRVPTLGSGYIPAYPLKQWNPPKPKMLQFIEVKSDGNCDTLGWQK